MAWEKWTEIADGRRYRRFRDERQSTLVYEWDDGRFTDGDNKVISAAEVVRLTTPCFQPSISSTAIPSQQPTYAPYQKSGGHRPAVPVYRDSRPSTASRIYSEQRVGTSHVRHDSGLGVFEGPAAQGRIGTVIRSFGTEKAEKLNPEYYVRGSGFFHEGREVFAMIWHESAGQPRKTKNGTRLSEPEEVNIDPFGEPIYSTVRRMVVVKEFHGYCWCLPVLTYNGRGCKKSGLSREDVARHAVIYMEDKNNYTLKPPKDREEVELGLVKEAIGVRPATPDQKLRHESRIHFGKLYTVEHDVKVMNVGDVIKDSKILLMTYFHSTLTPPQRVGHPQY